MELIGSLASPFVQRCLMVAHAKGHEIAVVMPEGGMQSPEFRKLSPLGRIPALRLDDGTALIESGAIAAYLDETLTGPSLLPSDPLDRARVRQIVDLTALELGSGLRPVVVNRLFRVPEAAGLCAPGIDQARKGCDAIVQVMGSGRYAFGDTLTMADCLLAPMLTLLEVMSREEDVAEMRGACPALGDYHARMADDPVAGRAIREMHETFRAILAGMAQTADA